MKKVIFTVTVLMFGIMVSFAQTKKKEEKKDKVLFKKSNFKTGNQSFQASDLFVSGTVFYTGEKRPNDSRVNSFTFSPRLGYFLNEKIAIGIDLNLNSTKTELDLSSDVNKTFGLGGFGRYYFSEGKFSLFGQLGVNYQSEKTESTQGVITPPATEVVYTVTSSKVNGIGLGLSAGANYFISNYFALETFIGVLNYSSLKADVPGAKARNNFNLGIDLSNIGFGLLYKF